MIVVSGCPRSGTSLMMDLMRVAFGEDRIVGEKFPQDKRRENFLKQGEEESDEHYAMMYIDSIFYDERKEEELKETKDMNPNGFWECSFTVQGVKYNFPQSDLLKEIAEEDKGNLSICKIVSQGLIASDPKYIDKIIFMVRHPRAVAKSQERLKRNFPFQGPNGERPEDEITIHTPEMFINVTVNACRFLLKYPDIPVKQVMFDDLIENPKETLNGIKDFLNCGGDFDSAIDQIEPKLRRSKHEDVENTLWEDAEFIYEKFINKEYEEILEYASDPTLPMNRERMRWFCPRAGRTVIEKQCVLCKEDETTRKNFKKYAEERGVEWKIEPCPYECGFDPEDDDPMTLEESINNNFWEDD